jgi:tripartite-type tricarboxylate transporter receptor subunit TctC
MFCLPAFPTAALVPRLRCGWMRCDGIARGVKRAQGVLLAVFLAAVSVSVDHAHAENSVQDFYAKHQIRFVIGSAGGGGYDFYSRLVGRYMTKHLPGHPTLVMQNMPGAAGVTAANYLYNVAQHDGSEIGMVGRAVGTLPLLDPKAKGPRYVATKLNWIGSPQQEDGLVLARTSTNIKTLDDLKTRQLLVSGTSKGSPPSFYPNLFNALFGTKFKVIEGYKGSQAALLALERGEVEGHVSGSSAAPFRARIASWIKDGSVGIVAQIALKKDPEYPDVPLILDLAKTEQQRDIMKLVLSQQVMGWPIVAPPDVPAERVAALRNAFDAVMKDPEFLAEAKKQNLVIDPVRGTEIAKLLEHAYGAPKDIINPIRKVAEED